MQASEVGKFAQGISSGRALAAKPAAVQGRARRLRRRVQALAAPATRTEARGDLQTQPPPSRFPDVDLSVAVPAGFADQAVPVREATAHASGAAVPAPRTLGPMTWYTERVEENPIVTKAFTSFFGFIIGDLLAQKIGGEDFSALRGLHLGLYGLLLDGPIGHLWYKLLDHHVCPDKPKSTKAVLLKTAADQVVWAPVMTIVFFAFLKAVEGHPELIWPTIQEKLVKTVVANYILWPVAHFINFRFVPSQHRILYNNLVAVFWNAWLSSFSSAPTVLDTDELAESFNRMYYTFDENLGDPLVGRLFDIFPPLHESADRISGSIFGGWEPLHVTSDRWLQDNSLFELPRHVAMSPTRTLLHLRTFGQFFF
eukprot:jgi/Botrbrau1/13320/Bobra.0315s0017.1